MSVLRHVPVASLNEMQDISQQGKSSSRWLCMLSHSPQTFIRLSLGCLLLLGHGPIKSYACANSIKRLYKLQQATQNKTRKNLIYLNVLRKNWEISVKFQNVGKMYWSQRGRQNESQFLMASTAALSFGKTHDALFFCSNYRHTLVYKFKWFHETYRITKNV